MQKHKVQLIKKEYVKYYPFFEFSKTKNVTKNPAGETDDGHINVYFKKLELCSLEPKTGYFRDGYCKSSVYDVGSHTICAKMTKDFLEQQKAIGNDLVTPLPQFGFPGLNVGDKWCVTARNWKRAFLEGKAAPVVLESSEVGCLRFTSLQELISSQKNNVAEQTIVIKK